MHQAANNDIRVLVADDFDMTRLLIRKALLDLGLSNVVEAFDGADTLTKLESAHKSKVPFDLLFLDWSMPRVDGMVVLQNCRSSEDFKSLPVIMISTERDAKAVKVAFEAGVTDYIVKPFSSEQIFQKLKRHGIIRVAA
jgi:two-component system chemotaxis response regulator CheY